MNLDQIWYLRVMNSVENDGTLGFVVWSFNFGDKIKLAMVIYDLWVYRKRKWPLAWELFYEYLDQLFHKNDWTESLAELELCFDQWVQLEVFFISWNSTESLRYGRKNVLMWDQWWQPCCSLPQDIKSIQF